MPSHTEAERNKRANERRAKAAGGRFGLPSAEKAREVIAGIFDTAKVAPGSASNKTLESVADKLQEVIGRKLKKQPSE